MTERRKFPLQVRKTAPLTYVLPPIAVALENAQAVAATEIAMMRDAQSSGESLTGDRSKALGALVTALIQSEKAKRELESDGVAELTDAELEAKLTEELESLRAKREKR